MATVVNANEEFFDINTEVPTSASTIQTWKRIMIVRKEPKLVRILRNFWPNRSYMLVYVMLLGNGPDGLPLCVRYSFDLSGGLFILLNILCTFLFVLPIMYMEIFLGKYTKMTNSQMYRMAPIFFGFTVLIFLVNFLYLSIRSSDTCLMFVLAMVLLINPKYLNQCPPENIMRLKNATCLNVTASRKLVGKNCVYTYLGFACDKVEYKFISEYNFWLRFQDLSHSYPFWQFIAAMIITWMLIMMICLLGMKTMSIFLVIAFAMNIVIYSVIFLMVATYPGGGSDGLSHLLTFKIYNLTPLELTKLSFLITMRMGIMCPSGYMTYAAYLNEKSMSTSIGPGAESLICCMINIFLNIYYLTIIHMISGALSMSYNIPNSATFVPGAGLYAAMIPEFLLLRQCPRIFVIMYHFSNWLLDLCRLAIGLQMFSLNLFDYFPKLTSYQSYAIIINGVAVGIVGILFIFEMCTIVLIPLFIEMNIRMLQGLLLTIGSLMTFYCYGVSRLNDDLHFVTGRRPIKFWRLLWYIYPIATTVGLMIVLLSHIEKKESLVNLDFPKHPILDHKVMMTHIFVAAYIIITLVSTFFFIVTGIRFQTTIMNLLKPQFHWGPPKREARIARKAFAPRTSIRSQPQKKKQQRYRPRSIKQMHERDIAEKVKRGRVFLDAVFFKNIDLEKRQQADHYRLSVKPKSA